MTMCRFIEEPCNGKLLSTVLKTNGVGDNLVEFTNYHKFCKMDGSRFSLWFTSYRTWKVFNKESKLDRESTNKLIKIAFPAVPYSENKFVNVKGNKSPYDGDLTYWSERNSKLYDGETSKALKRQNHTCGYCGYKCTSNERVHLHHMAKARAYKYITAE